MTKNENIKNLWKQLFNDGTKTEFIKNLAIELKRSPNTINNHWFGRFWLVPQEHEDKVIEMLQKQIAKQNQLKTA